MKQIFTATANMFDPSKQITVSVDMFNACEFRIITTMHEKNSEKGGSCISWASSVPSMIECVQSIIDRYSKGDEACTHKFNFTILDSVPFSINT
jgi:hypothetical protein